MLKNVSIDCGWGKLFFAQTFAREKTLYHSLCKEKDGTRNIGFYVENPHVISAHYPQQLFIDPSHTYRRNIRSSEQYAVKAPTKITIREAVFPADVEQINAVYVSQQALELPKSFRPHPSLTLFVAEDDTGQIVGVCMWINHMIALKDPEKGSSLWALAVLPSCPIPGIGMALVQRCLLASQKARCAFLDLSVMDSNHKAIALYKKLDFHKTPWLAVKNKSKVNEALFTPKEPNDELSMRAKVILGGARKRGIETTIVDRKGFFSLSLGGRVVHCYESLTDLTNAIALKWCDNHGLTNTILAGNNLCVPEQEEFVSLARAEKFLHKHGTIVTKVLRGTKFRGTTVDIRTPAALKNGIAKARKYGDRVLLEQAVRGERYRILLINFTVVGILRVTEPTIVGTGKHSVRTLIQKANRRLKTQYDDMKIPLDSELRECLREHGVELDSVPKKNKVITIRKFANYQTGECLESVRPNAIAKKHLLAARKAAHALRTPVVNIEMKIQGDTYAIIKADERPSLASPHDPRVIDAFLDFLFPQMVPKE